nr:hypothetical protein [Kibdelosporangium sp. MJ126-NF4]CTQ89974.1 hypothetical protein [Kibdelosporangium sp. MJ126-NF4]
MRARPLTPKAARTQGLFTRKAGALTRKAARVRACRLALALPAQADFDGTLPRICD